MNYLVCGPPGSGKTTWVEGRRRWGDVIVDLDGLFAAVSGLPWYEKPEGLLPLALALQETAVGWVVENPERFTNGWVISGAPRARERAELGERLGAAVVVLEVEPGECLRRIAADPRRAGMMTRWQPIVERWWREYERGVGELVVRESRGAGGQGSRGAG